MADDLRAKIVAGTWSVQGRQREGHFYIDHTAHRYKGTPHERDSRMAKSLCGAHRLPDNMPRFMDGLSWCTCGDTFRDLYEHRATALLPLVREAQETAWDNAKKTLDEHWAKAMGWAVKSNPKREDFPPEPTNPYRTGDDHAR